jgi:hypothetical protein
LIYFFASILLYCVFKNSSQGRKVKKLDSEKLSAVIAYARDTLKVKTSEEFFNPTNFDQIVMKLPGCKKAASFGVVAKHGRRWRSNLKYRAYADQIWQGNTFITIYYRFQLRHTINLHFHLAFEESHPFVDKVETKEEKSASSDPHYVASPDADMVLDSSLSKDNAPSQKYISQTHKEMREKCKLFVLTILLFYNFSFFMFKII